MRATSMGVREAKINLSKLLKKAKDGEEVIITDRGKPVARIITISAKPPSVAERVNRAEKQGLLDPAPPKRRKVLPPPLPGPPGIAQKYLQEQRNT